MPKKVIKGITKSMSGGNYTLSGKQKKMDSTPAPKFKPRDRKAGNKFTAKKGKKVA